MPANPYYARIRVELFFASVHLKIARLKKRLAKFLIRLSTRIHASAESNYTKATKHNDRAKVILEEWRFRNYDATR